MSDQVELKVVVPQSVLDAIEQATALIKDVTDMMENVGMRIAALEGRLEALEDSVRKQSLN